MSIYIPTDRLSAEGLSISIEGNTLISNIDLYLSVAEMVYVYAPKIAWSRTLLKALYLPKSRHDGELKIGNQFIKSDTLSKDIKKTIGFMVEEYPLFFDWSAKENLLFACDHCATPDAKKTLEELITYFGMSSILDKKVNQLNNDQLFLLMYVRASIHRPSLIFCDQSITELSSSSLALLMEHINYRIQNEKTSLIFTIDNKALVETYPARTYVIDLNGLKAE